MVMIARCFSRRLEDVSESLLHFFEHELTVTDGNGTDLFSCTRMLELLVSKLAHEYKLKMSEMLLSSHLADQSSNRSWRTKWDPLYNPQMLQSSGNNAYTRECRPVGNQDLCHNRDCKTPRDHHSMVPTRLAIPKCPSGELQRSSTGRRNWTTSRFTR